MHVLQDTLLFQQIWSCWFGNKRTAAMYFHM